MFTELKIRHFHFRTYIFSITLMIISFTVAALIFMWDNPWYGFAFAVPLFPAVGIMVALYQVWIATGVFLVLKVAY
eukprot:UN04814